MVLGCNITFADAALLLLLATANGILYAVPVEGAKQQGARVEVANAATGEKHSYPLHEDNRLQLQGRYGDSTIEFENGKVRFATAPCRRKICMNAGWMNIYGQWAACLENGISIRVLGDKIDYDSISY